VSPSTRSDDAALRVARFVAGASAGADDLRAWALANDRYAVSNALRAQGKSAAEQGLLEEAIVLARILDEIDGIPHQIFLPVVAELLGSRRFDEARDLALSIRAD
jgi:hypothetical protein